MSDTSILVAAMTTLLTELVDGNPNEGCFVLNPGDAGLLRSLDRLSAADASAPSPGGGASIAAHVDHVCYGLELLNRWPEDPAVFDSADYSISWRRITVSGEEWTALRARLASELRTWRQVIVHVDPSQQLHVTGAIASIVHLAYHLGAIRQINRGLAGPSA